MMLTHIQELRELREHLLACCANAESEERYQRAVTGVLGICRRLDAATSKKGENHEPNP